MGVEASAIVGMAGAVPTNVAVTTAGHIITDGSTTAPGAIQLSTSAMNPVTLAPSTALNTVSVAVSTAAAISAVAVTTAAAMAGSTAGSATKNALKGVIACSCTGSASTSVLAYSTAASSTVFTVVLVPGAYWEMPVPLFTGGLSLAVSTGLGASGTATVLLTELS